MVIIKDYKMPYNCYDCELHNYHECDLTCESIEDDYCWNGDSREKHCPLREVEAILKVDYESRLKADLVAMLTDIQLEFEELQGKYSPNYDEASQHLCNIIQQKINELKGNREGSEET